MNRRGPCWCRQRMGDESARRGCCGISGEQMSGVADEKGKSMRTFRASKPSFVWSAAPD